MASPPPARRVGFEEHIARNKRTTVLVVVFMLVLLFSVVYAIGYLVGAEPVITFPLALVVAVVYVLVTYRMSVAEVVRAARARPANPEVRAEKLLMFRVEEIAIAAGLPVPKVYVQDSKDINAFASGLKPEASIVCVTTGALEQLDQEELEGVIAHEMSHIANYDVRLATVTVGVIGAIAMLAEIGIRLAWAGGGRGKKGGNAILLVVAIAALVLAPVFSRLTYLFLSRRREYLADATGAKLSRNPEGLARALAKIKGDLPDDPKGSKTVAGLYISNPWKRALRQSVWSTHPPLDDRIERLRNM